MAKSLNRCTFIGRLTRDPEARFMPDGTATSKFSLAVNDDKKDKHTGTTRDHAEFINFTVIGKLAEICNQFLKKGKEIYAEGKMVTRKYTDSGGIDRWATEIQLESMQMLGGRDDGGTAQHGGSQPPRARQTPPPSSNSGNYQGQDIPF